MGRIIKKGTRGAATKYINRSQAVKRLQISLKDFRRLCILKGIYPREPKHKRKIQHGSTLNTTWYYRSDVMRLQHEPLLQKFREWKAFARKLARFVHKEQWSSAEALESSQQPEIKIDHIIRERYPAFEDALRDLDDALSMVYLFSTLAQPTREYKAEFLEACQRRTQEFENYLVRTRALRKAFVSVKGIYYQAIIQGVHVTWIVPHAFTQSIPVNVDFRVMFSFLQLYETLVGFVVFRLYRQSELAYPPPPLLLQADVVPEAASSVPAKSAACTIDGDGEFAETVGEEGEGQEEAENSHSEGSLATANSTTGSVGGRLLTYADIASQSTTPLLFGGMVFFFGRETNVRALSLLVRCMGATVVVDDESCVRITHHVVDRCLVGGKRAGAGVCAKASSPGRVYMQPQWVFDCLNTGRLQLISGSSHGVGYAPGDRMPPHLSPFVETSDALEYNPRDEVADEPASANTTAAAKAEAKESKAQKGMACMLMSKRERYLYNAIVRRQRRQLVEIERLRARKRALATSEHRIVSGGGTLY